MKRLLIILATVPVLTTWGAIKARHASAWPATETKLESSILNLGANLRTVWAVEPGGSLGAASPVSAASACGFYAKDNLGALAEFGVAAEESNQVASLYAGYLFNNWIFVAGGLDSRYIFQRAGIGPSASLSFLVPVSEGSAGRLEARYSWFGRDPEDGGGQVSLGFGILSDF